jgi:hypothetical protein
MIIIISLCVIIELLLLLLLLYLYLLLYYIIYTHIDERIDTSHRLRLPYGYFPPFFSPNKKTGGGDLALAATEVGRLGVDVLLG